MDKAIETISAYLRKREGESFDVTVRFFLQPWTDTKWYGGIELVRTNGTVRQYEDWGETPEEVVKGVAYRLNNYR